MLGLKSCLTILVGYVVAVCALFSSKGRNPSLNNWEKLKDQKYSTVDNFGLTGHSLLQFFQDNLALLSLTEEKYHHKSSSFYYDVFKEYILRNDNPKNCSACKLSYCKVE